MQPDLDDAFAAVDWGETQIQPLGQMFANWMNLNIGIAIKESDPQSGKKVAILRKKGELPVPINAGVGSIINSFRSALDLLAAALARRNGKRPNESMHFPIFRSLYDFIDPKDGVEAKKWLFPRDITILKSLCPYNGGNDLLWSLHQLDILRKHERLIKLSAKPRTLTILSEGSKVTFFAPTSLEDESELFEFSSAIPQPEAALEFTILFDETGLPIDGKPVFPTLNQFRNTTLDIIRLFDTP